MVIRKGFFISLIQLAKNVLGAPLQKTKQNKQEESFKKRQSWVNYLNIIIKRVCGTKV